jgi:hypothetical protein
MFGRELSEQIETDGQPVPVIVTKCIEAVEAQGEFSYPQLQYFVLCADASILSTLPISHDL